MDKVNKKQFIINLQMLDSDTAIDKYYNLETLYEKGSASYTYTPTEENQIHIKLLVDEFMSINYAFNDDDIKKGYNMRSNLKKLCADGRIEKRRGSHLYREFYNFAQNQKWYHKWNLMMNGGEDSTKSEQMILKQLRIENEKLKAENNKLLQKNKVLKNSNAGLRKQVKLENTLLISNTEKVSVSIDETKNVEKIIEPTPEPEKKKRPVPPQAILPDECLIESSDEEEVEEVVEEEVNLYIAPPHIKWECLANEDQEKILRNACNDYREVICNDYQKDFNTNGEDSTPHYEIVLMFEEWFAEQRKCITENIDFKQIEDKFLDEIEKSLEFISPY